MSTVRLVLVGAGGIARRHAGVLAQLPAAEVAGVVDVDPDRAADLAREFGADSGANLPQLLDRVRPDAAMIFVPPFAHGDPERECIDRGLPFFVEKPVGLDPDAAHRVERASAHLPTAVGYHWRCLDGIGTVRAALEQRPAALVNGFWLDATPPVPWWWREELSGGQFVEQLTHVVDLARFLVGDIVEVTAVTQRSARDGFPGLDVPTAGAVLARFDSGAIGTFAATCLLGWPHRVGLHLFGDGQAIEITDHDLVVDVGRGRPVTPFEHDPVLAQDRAFLAAVLGEGEVACSYADALATLEVTLAMVQSARVGRSVTLGRQARS